MAVSISPTNPGPVHDPRLRETDKYVAALQGDLNQQARELRAGTENVPRGTGNWMPVDRQLFDPRKYPRGFMPGKRLPAGHMGTFGGVVRIES